MENRLLLKRIIFTAFLIFFVISFTLDAFSQRKRSYNPKQTRQNAIQTIRANSEEISTLLGVEPILNNQVCSNSDDSELDESDLFEIDRIGLEEGEEGEDLDELEREDNVIIDMDNFRLIWLSFMGYDEEDELMPSGISKVDMMDVIMEWLGTPYRFGGNSTRAIDCSAFVRAIFRNAGNIMLPRTAREQNTVGQKIKRKDLEFGDLVFFNTRRAVYVSHVGIYLADDLFVHASSRWGVTVSSLNSDYYNKRFIGGKRITQTDLIRLSIEPKNTTDNQ